MAYTDDEFLVTARGTLAGGEIWNNVWCAKRSDPVATPASLLAIVNSFYADVMALHIANDTTVAEFTARNLATDVVSSLVLNPVGSGSDSTNPPLPNQAAIRCSLKAVPNFNGGPFIAGWSAGALSTTGDLLAADLTGLATALDTFHSDLANADWDLQIHLPTQLTTIRADQGRVGARFDVIRKRANERLEAYSLVTF